jgi:hypothetical protein
VADCLVPGSRNRGQRPWGLLLLVVLGLALPAVVFGQGTITALEQGQLTVSVGSRSGVKVGMQGGIVKPFRLQDTITNHLIGRFEVIEVEENRCFISDLTRERWRSRLAPGPFDKQLRPRAAGYRACALPRCQRRARSPYGRRERRPVPR